MNRCLATWGGFLLGALTVPALLLTVARTMRHVSGSLDVSGEAGVARADAGYLAGAVDRYRAHYHEVPDLRRGLSALVPEFIEHLPVDPWGNPYVYSANEREWADVLSYGADGRPGGRGAAADISGRFGRLAQRPPAFIQSLVVAVVLGTALAAAMGARRSSASAAALGGLAAFLGLALLVTSSTAFLASLVPWLAFACALTCLVGAIAILRALPYATPICLISIVSACLLLEVLLGA